MTAQSPVSPALVALVVGTIFLSVFAWAWAVRRPAVTGSDSNSAPVQSPTPANQKPVTYAAIGASDVVGVGADDPDNENWVSVLYRKLPPGSRLVRLGRSGMTLAEANAIEVPKAVSAQPDVVTLWNCVNDATGGVSLPDYLEQLDLALSRLTKGTKAKVLLLNLPDMSLISPGGEEERALIQGGVGQWNAAMATTAEKYGDRVKLVDLFPVSREILERPDYLSPDNFHPSTNGYHRLADVVWAEMEKELQ